MAHNSTILRKIPIDNHNRTCYVHLTVGPLFSSGTSMSKIFTKIPRVIVLLLTAFKVHRDCLKGIIRYARLHGPWEFHIIEGREAEQSTLNFKTWNADGLIAYANNNDYCKTILQSSVPSILIDPWDHHQEEFPLDQHNIILCDSFAVGKAAADFFLQQKFRHFGYVSEAKNAQWSRERGRGFASHIQAAGFEYHSYENHSLKEQNDWGLEQKRLKKWLLGLPKPIALLAAMDVRGRQVIEVCRSANLSVPYEIAVLGVDNDELLCESTNPSLSSLMMTIDEACFEGAARLDRLMRKKEISTSSLIHYGPKEVVVRRSTNPTIISDKLVIQALEFIEVNACVPITVSDVVKFLGISRRSAELRFHKELRHTILDEINRIRLEKVVTFLKQTDMSIAEISRITGFTNGNYLACVFRKHLHMSMSDFRNLHAEP